MEKIKNIPDQEHLLAEEKRLREADAQSKLRLAQIAKARGANFRLMGKEDEALTQEEAAASYEKDAEDIMNEES